MKVNELISELAKIKDLSDMEIKVEDDEFWVTDAHYVEVVDIDGKDCLCIYSHRKYLPPSNQ